MARHSAAPHAAAELPSKCLPPPPPIVHSSRHRTQKFKVGFSHACAALPGSSDHRPSNWRAPSCWRSFPCCCTGQGCPMPVLELITPPARPGATRGQRDWRLGFSACLHLKPEGSFLTEPWAMGIPMPVLRYSVPLKAHLVWISRASPPRHWASRADGIIGMGSEFHQIHKIARDNQEAHVLLSE